jgi:hypothetical protein
MAHTHGTRLSGRVLCFGHLRDTINRVIEATGGARESSFGAHICRPRVLSLALETAAARRPVDAGHSIVSSFVSVDNYQQPQSLISDLLSSLPQSRKSRGVLALELTVALWRVVTPSSKPRRGPRQPIGFVRQKLSPVSRYDRTKDTLPVSKE